MQVIIQRLLTLYFLKVPHLFIHTNIITAEHLFLCTLKAKKVISLSCIFFGHQLIRLYKAWISMNYFNYYIRADVLVESSQSYPKSLRIFSVSTSVNLFFKLLIYFIIYEGLIFIVVMSTATARTLLSGTTPNFRTAALY